MAWSGYFMFGGTELINATRTEAYAKHYNVGWFRPIYNEVALSWLLGDPRYTTPLQDDAPWTDPDNLDSYDFYGVYPLEITGIEDGTTDATVVESVIDGGYIGRTRKKTRTVVFSAVLTGASECAVEYGHRWLRSVLTGGPCYNQAYGQCGGVDLCYLSCPPVITEVEPTYSLGEPVLDSRNFASNPGGEILGSQGWNPNNAAHHVMSATTVAPISNTRSILSTRQAGAIATNLAYNPISDSVNAATFWYPTRSTTAAGPGYLRSTITDATVGSLLQRVNSPASINDTQRVVVVPGETVRASAQVRSSASAPMGLYIVWLDAAAVDVGVDVSPTVTTNPTTWTDIPDFSAVAPAGAVTAQVRIGIGGTGPRAIGDTFDVRHTMIVKSTTPVPYFDGDTGSALTHRWTGTVNASTSEQITASNSVKRTNLAMNPALEGGVTTGWNTNDGTRYPATLDTASRMSGVNSMMTTRTATTPNTTAGSLNVGARIPSGQVPVVEGNVYTFGLDVKAELAGRRARLSYLWYDSGKVPLTPQSTVGAFTNLTAGQTTRLVFTTIAPPLAAYAYPVVEVYTVGGENSTVGERCWFDRATIESSVTDGSYFDGSTPTIPASNPAGTSYRWTGTPNNSTSEKVGVADAEVASIYLAPGDQPLSVLAETPVTVGVDVKVEQANRKVYGYLSWLGGGGNSSQFEIPAGAPGEVVRLVITGTPPPGTTQAYPVITTEATTGSALTGERVWFDNLYIGGDPSGDYFDGASSPSNPYTYAWAGTPHASGSYRYKDTWVQDPDPTAEDCYSRIGRSLHEVTTTVGPTVTQKLEMNDGGAAWQVTWTMVAANPAEFGVEKPLVVGFLDPAVEIPYYGGILPPGGEFDEHGNVQNESPCAVPVFRPVYDPLCGLLSAPPDVPSVVPMCFSFPPNFLRTSFSIPREEIPLWTTVTPIISLSTKTAEARSVRVRFYADMFDTGDPSQDPCNFCGDVVFSYIPPSSTIVLDCADRAVYIDQPGFGRRRADALITNSKGEPFEWPEFSCGYGYVVTVDMPQQMTQRPILDLSLVPRMA